MSKFGPNCQYFVWPPLFSSTALTLLGMEFTRTSQVSTGVLFHSSMMTSQSWWMLETLCSSTFRLKMPHRLPLPSASLARQWSSWRCVWGGYHVGILPCSPISKGRGACSASVCHSCRASSHRMMTFPPFMCQVINANQLKKSGAGPSGAILLLISVNWPLLPDPLRMEFLTSYLEKIRQRLQTLPESPNRLMPKYIFNQPTRDSHWLMFPRFQGTDFRMTSEPLLPLLEQLQRALFRCE